MKNNIFQFISFLYLYISIYCGYWYIIYLHVYNVYLQQDESNMCLPILHGTQTSKLSFTLLHYINTSVINRYKLTRHHWLDSGWNCQKRFWYSWYAFLTKLSLLIIPMPLIIYHKPQAMLQRQFNWRAVMRTRYLWWILRVRMSYDSHFYVNLALIVV